jgi:hypothetical protein
MFDRITGTFSVQANSDYYPVLDQNAGKARFLMTHAQDLVSFSQEAFPAFELATGYRPPWKYTDISVAPYFKKTRSVAIAASLRDCLLKGDFDESDWDLLTSSDIRQKALQFKKFFYDCSALSPKQRIILLFESASMIFPYLRPEESEAIWRIAEAGTCYSGLTSEEKNWVSLFRAIGSRDAGKMRFSAAVLLSDGEKTTAEMGYLVAAALLGNLTEAKHDENRRLWNQYRQPLFGAALPSLFFRFLAADSL